MEQKIQLSESQLRKLIKESVKKALVKEWRELTASEKEWRDIEREREDKKCAKENDDAVEKSKFAKKMLGKKSGELDEISSDMISRAKSKFYQKYGGTMFPGPDAKDFPKDEHGNRLYPKDMKPLAQHYRNFDQALDKAKRDEQFENPVTVEAMRIFDENWGDIDWEETDDYGNEGKELSGYLEVDGWEFEVVATTDNARTEFYYDVVDFKSPDGQEGSFRP